MQKSFLNTLIVIGVVVFCIAIQSYVAGVTDDFYAKKYGAPTPEPAPAIAAVDMAGGVAHHALDVTTGAVSWLGASHLVLVFGVIAVPVLALLLLALFKWGR